MNILTKPYTDKDYADFAVVANTNGQRIEQDLIAFYALCDYEAVQNGEIVDISNTDEYKAKILVEQNEVRKADLKTQIDELDLKRIRAGFEPAVKDETTGETYLEYYTEQIIALRNELNSL